MVILVVIGALGAVLKGLEELESRGRIENIEKIPARILRKIRENKGDLLSLSLQ